MGGLGRRPWRGVLLLGSLLAGAALLWGQEEAPGPPPPFPGPAGETGSPPVAGKVSATPRPAALPGPVDGHLGDSREIPSGAGKSVPESSLAFPDRCPAGAASPVVEQHTFRLLHPISRTPAVGEVPAPPPGSPSPSAISSYLPPALSRKGATLLPSLTLEQHGPQTLRVGQTGRYEFLVRNVGSLPAAELRLEVDLPEGVELRQSEPVAGVAGQHLHWLLPSLAPGEERRYQVEVRALAAGERTSRARLILSLAEIHKSLQLVPPGLKLQLHGPAQATVGDKVEVQIRLLNELGQPVPGVLLRATLSEGLSHESGSQIEAGPFEIGPGGKDISLTVRATRPGSQTLEVAAGSGAWEVRARWQVQVREVPVRPPAVLHLSKRGSNRLHVGDLCDYELRVRNDGPNPIQGICIRDQLPGGLEFVSATAGGRYDAARHLVEWHLGALGPQQQQSVQVRVRAQRVGEQRNPVSVQGEPDHEAHLTAVMQVDNPGAPAAEQPQR